MPNGTNGKFELRKVHRDSTGKERYIKTDEDDAIFKSKVQEMGARAAAELKDASFDERWKWVVDRKEEGNNEYKNKEFEGALDGYLLALCGLGFDKSITQEQKTNVENQLKLPVLNNMALCLIHQKKFPRAL